ncbi:guanylate kinase [bacterium]|nr:guanylate kinase [bacterium]
MARKGILFVISGPSGTGKGTVLKEVFKNIENLHYSVSATTREPRNGEKEGINYYFISKEKFDKMVSDGEMLEHVTKFTNWYGTPKKAVEEKLNNGQDVILEIETIGANNVQKAMKECISIFIAPPSLKELWQRLDGRNTEVESNKKVRFETSREELLSAYNFDYVVINDVVSDCARKVVNIIEAERLKVTRNKDAIEKILLN